MTPVSDLIALPGTTICAPFDMRTAYPGLTPNFAYRGSVQTPAAMIVDLALTLISSPVSLSVTTAPTTFLPFMVKSLHVVRVVMTAPYFAAVRAIDIVCRASSTCASKY